MNSCVDLFASRTQVKSGCGQGVLPARSHARKLPSKFRPFATASSDHKQTSRPESTLSRRQTLQQIALAAAALSAGTTAQLSLPQSSDAALVQFPAADFRNSYYLVRFCMSRSHWTTLDTKQQCLAALPPAQTQQCCCRYAQERGSVKLTTMSSPTQSSRLRCRMA